MKRLLAILAGCLFVLSSCEDLLEVPDISLESVELLAPSDSTIVTQSDVNFTWNEVFEAEQYHVQVAVPNFENATQIAIDTLMVVDSSYVSPRFSKNLADSEYEWRVKARNSAYETDYSAKKFTVDTSGN